MSLWLDTDSHSMGVGGTYLRYSHQIWWSVLILLTELSLSIYLSLHHVPKDISSMNKISPSIPILSIPISLEEGAASNDIIFPSLPWSSLSVGTRDHFHKNAFEKTHVAHSANMTKPGQLWFSNATKDTLGFKFAGGNS